MADPISHFQKQVDALNKNKKQAGVKKISERSPSLYLGYFPLKSILEKLKIKKYVDFFNLTNDFKFDLFQLLSSLIFARSVHSCSKYKTFHEVLPSLFHSYDYTYDQLRDGLAFIGNNYEKFIEIFTSQVRYTYGIDTSKIYFDCTNFYFEIDREDDFRKKGTSKEYKKDPIVGLSLLLDSNQLPIRMKMYPGNQSEKPVLRDVITHLKKQNNVSGKTIHVADKELNCAQNIAFSKKCGDGYLFSKTVKGLSEKEKVWVLLNQDFKEVKYKSGKILYYYKSCIDEFPYKIEHQRCEVTIHLTTYHNLWRIEESFKIMKSDLDARPVFLQKEETIKGHFLICYLTVLLERLFQFKVLENKYSTSEIFNFIKKFKATKAENKYINTTTYSEFINDLSVLFDLPLTNYFLSETQIKSIFTYKL